MIAVSVCLSRGSTRLHRAETVKWIKMPFGVNTHGGPLNIVLDGGSDLSHREGSHDLLIEFWDPLVSPGRLKLQI